MSSILEPLLSALKESNWSTFFVVIGVALLFNLRSISTFLEDRAARHQRFVENALKLEALSETSRRFLEEELNYFIFRRITGISADATLREKLREIIARGGGELQIRQLSRAREFIRMKNGRLNISVTPFDRVWSFANFFFSALVSIIALAMFMLPGLAPGSSLVQIATSMAFGTFFFAFALFMAWEASAAMIARRIAPLVELLESESGDA